MGLLISRIWKRLFAEKREFKLIILGLAGAGKTTMLYQLHLGKAVQTQPTIGSNVEEVKHKNVKLQGVIFVIDSTDKDFEISRKALGDLLKNDDLKTSKFLFMANKQDMKDAMSSADVAEKFHLADIKDHEWHIQACSALNGNGLKEGIDWLTERILSQKP